MIGPVRLSSRIGPFLVVEHFSLSNRDLASRHRRAIDGFKGTLVVGSALQLIPLVMLRPGELRALTWAEVDLEHAGGEPTFRAVEYTDERDRSRFGEWFASLDARLAERVRTAVVKLEAGNCGG